MDTIRILADLARLPKRTTQTITDFTLRKVGSRYYIYAISHDSDNPAVVGRYTDLATAQQTLAYLQGIVHKNKE